MMKNYTGLALQEERTNVRKVILPLPFRQGSHFFLSWSAVDSDISPSFTISLLHRMVHLMTQTRKARKHGANP